MRIFWTHKISYSFLFLFFFIETVSAQNMDIDFLKEANVHRNQHLDGTFQFISNTEGFIGIGTPIAICAAGIIQHDKKLLNKGITMTVGLVTATTITYGLKKIINRDRPAQTYPYIQAFEKQKHYSFPSGHTSNAFVTATNISLACRKWYVVAPSFIWASSVGYSRMHLGMHYPSDVAVGALIGMGSAWLAYKTNKYYKKFYTKKELKNPL